MCDCEENKVRSCGHCNSLIRPCAGMPIKLKGHEHSHDTVFPFMRLPAELRLHVYENALSDPVRPGLPLALLHLSPQVRAESKSMWDQSTTCATGQYRLDPNILLGVRACAWDFEHFMRRSGRDMAQIRTLHIRGTPFQDCMTASSTFIRRFGDISKVELHFTVDWSWMSLYSMTRHIMPHESEISYFPGYKAVHLRIICAHEHTHACSAAHSALNEFYRKHVRNVAPFLKHMDIHVTDERQCKDVKPLIGG